MNTDLTTHAETAYQGFLAIDAGDYRDKIRYVDRHRHALIELPVYEYAEVMDAYAEALFETGRFEKHISLADHLVALAMEHNISDVNGRDLYYDTLFQKAASLYNLDYLPEATYILEELIRINPKHESTRLFLINCHVRAQKERIKTLRNVSIVLILSSAAVIAVELLLVRPLFPGFVAPVETARNVLFFTGAGVLVTGELWIRYRAVSRVYELAKR